MPRIREHKRPPVQALLVSPWQSKGHTQPPSSQTPHQEAPLMYSVVEADMLVTSRSHSQAAPTPTTADSHPHAPPAAHTQVSGAWHTRARKTAAANPPAAAPGSTADSPQPQQHTSQLLPPPQQQQHRQPQPQQQQQQFEEEPADLEPSADATTEAEETDDTQGADQLSSPQSTSSASKDWLQQEEDPQAAGAAADAGAAGAAESLHGVAQLVLHPSGAITGHFVALTQQQPLNTNSNTSSIPSNSTAAAVTKSSSITCKPAGGASSSGSGRGNSRLCLGLHGRQVLGIHSCYRDPEWALLQLSVIRYGSAGGSPAIAAALLQQQPSQSDIEDGDAAAAAAGNEAQHAGAKAAGGDAAAAEADGDDEGAAAAGHAEAAGSDAAAAAAEGQAESEAEATAWVQRMGGDLVTLVPADFDDEDTEIAVRAENMGELPWGNVTVNFSAHTLVAGAAAARTLQQTRPELAGDPDLVVNLGEMSICGLPAGFLGSSSLA